MQKGILGYDVRRKTTTQYIQRKRRVISALGFKFFITISNELSETNTVNEVL